MKVLTRIVVAVLVIGASLGCHRNQPQTGFSGQVVDVSGKPVVGATLQMGKREGPGFVGAATDLDGRFKFPNLERGVAYDLRVEATGYRALTLKQYRPKAATVTFTMDSGFGLRGGYSYRTDEKGLLLREDGDHREIALAPRMLVEEQRVWCAVYGDMIATERGEIGPVFLSLNVNGAAVPDDSALECLREKCSRVQLVTSAKAKDSTYCDPQTGELGIVLTVAEVRFETPRRCHVGATHYVGPLSSGGLYYLLEKREGRWIIKEKETIWIS